MDELDTWGQRVLEEKGSISISREEVVTVAPGEMILEFLENAKSIEEFSKEFNDCLALIDCLKKVDEKREVGKEDTINLSSSEVQQYLNAAVVLDRAMLAASIILFKNIGDNLDTGDVENAKTLSGMFAPQMLEAFSKARNTMEEFVEDTLKEAIQHRSDQIRLN